MAPLTHVFFHQEPERFLDRLAACRWQQTDAVSFPLLSRYYRTYFAPDWRGDASFLVLRESEPVAFVRAQAVGNRLTDNARGVTIEIGAQDPGPAAILQGLEQAARAFGATGALVADTPRGGGVSPLGRRLLLARAVPTPRVHAVVDLTVPVAAIRAGLRDSYRSLINWGNREMRFELHRGAGYDPAALDRFHAFHVAVAGRETRSAESWAIQGDMIAADRAELVLGHLEGHGLVASQMLYDWGSTTLYASAVYDRDLFDKPLAHAGLHGAILRAKERGQSRFLLGEIPAAGTASDKEISIGFFKAGFTNAAEWTVEWDVRYRDDAARHD